MTSEGNKALLPTYPRMLTVHEIYFYKFGHEKVLLRGLYNKSLKDWSLGEEKFILFPSNLNIEILRVRVKGGMSLRNGMWHGLRNGIIMRNVIYAE